MREIKFRAWDKDKKEMLYHDRMHVSVHGDDGFYIYRGLNTSIDGELMQFTGLLDQNGKEMYEGDILQAPWGIEEVKWALDWNEEMEDFRAGWLLSEKPKRYEVIGNIYENPELLVEHNP